MADASDKAAAEVAYENTADQVWADRALELLNRRELQVATFDAKGVVSAQVWGPCPRCGHELNIQQTLRTPMVSARGDRGLWSALAGRDGRAAARIPADVDLGCGCGHAHPGAPGQATGCGVSFRLPTCPPDAHRAS